jgi:hypothetical protein
LDAILTGFTNYMPGTIQEGRIYTIKSMIAVIYDLIVKYSAPNILCQNCGEFPCDANLLGSLVKGSAIIGIWPLPADPYPGINSRTLADQIRGMRVLDKCEMSSRVARHYSPGYSHGIKDSIEASLRSLEDRTRGLHLTSFLPKSGKGTKNEKKRQARIDEIVGKQQRKS